jgi:hypothetical protein
MPAQPRAPGGAGSGPSPAPSSMAGPSERPESGDGWGVRLLVLHHVSPRGSQSGSVRRTKAVPGPGPGSWRAGRAGPPGRRSAGVGGLAAVAAGDLQAVEPGRPAVAKAAVDADLVAHRRLRRGSPPTADQPARRAPQVSDSLPAGRAGSHLDSRGWSLLWPARYGRRWVGASPGGGNEGWEGRWDLHDGAARIQAVAGLYNEPAGGKHRGMG